MKIGDLVKFTKEMEVRVPKHKGKLGVVLEDRLYSSWAGWCHEYPDWIRVFWLDGCSTWVDIKDIEIVSEV